MSKCLQYICCCFTNKNDQDDQKNDQLKDFSRIYLENNSQSFTFKGVPYVILEQIGQGAFSEVYKVINKTKDRVEVLKKLILKDSINEYLSEYNILKSIKHQFIVEFYDCLIINDELCFLMEFAQQGSLQQFIDNPFIWKQQIQASIILDICEGIFIGVGHLQEKKILHRDLKPDNILLSSFKAKIADLGLSKFLISKYANTNVGNILYAAPEKQMAAQNGYGLKSDIYSAGMILCQLLLRLSGKQIAQINFLKNMSCLDNIPDQLKDLITKLLSNKPEERPTCDVAIKEIKNLRSNEIVMQFIQDRYKSNSIVVEQAAQSAQKQQNQKKSITIQDDKLDSDNQNDISQLNKPLLLDQKESYNMITTTNTQQINIVEESQLDQYKPENEQWFEQNFAAGAISVLRFKDYQKGISQFEKLLKVEVRDEFRIQKKLMMIQWLLKKRNFTLLPSFSLVSTQQEYQKAKEYAEEYLNIDPYNQNTLSIFVISMIKLKFTEIEILIQVEKIIEKVYFGGLLLFMTLIDIQKYIHVSYAQKIASNSTYFNDEVLLGCSLYFFSKNQKFNIQKIIGQQQHNKSEQIEYINWLISRMDIQIDKSLYEQGGIFNDLSQLKQFEDTRQGLCYFTLLQYKYNQYLFIQETKMFTLIQEQFDQALLMQEEFFNELNKLQKNYLEG